MLCRDGETAHAEDVGACIVDRERQKPARNLCVSVEEARDHDERRPGDGGSCQPVGSLADVDVRGRLGEEHDVQDTDGEVGQAEEHRVAVEGVRNGERRHEHGAHGGEDGESRRALVGVDLVGEPGVGAPRPPERRQDQHALADARPRRVVRHEAGDLREREDEDEVEEKLERRDRMLELLAFDLRLDLVLGLGVHAGMIAAALPGAQLLEDDRVDPLGAADPFLEVLGARPGGERVGEVTLVAEHGEPLA